MPAEKPFDPYHRWLGISPADQPPNYYGLLGIGLFERDAEVIDEAVERQTTHIRKYLQGPQAAQAKVLLQKIGLARDCLLKPDLKARYDAALKSQLPQQEPAAAPANSVASERVPAESQPPAPQAASPPTATNPSSFGEIMPTSNETVRRRKPARRSTTPGPWIAGGLLVGALALGGAGWWFNQGGPPGESHAVSKAARGTVDSGATATDGDSTGTSRTSARSKPAAPTKAAPTQQPGDSLVAAGRGVETASPPSALEFDGQSQHVALGNPPALNITGPITLSAWVRPQATDGLRHIVSHGFCMNPAAEVCLRMNDGKYQVGSWDGVSHVASADVPPSDVGAWVQLTGVYDGTVWKLFRNGVLLTTKPSKVGAVPVTVDWAIGAAGGAAAGGGAERCFQGGVADVRIYRRGLSDSEVQELFSLPPGAALGDDHKLSKGLVGAWALDSSSGVAVDRSFNHNDGKLVGSPRSIAGPRGKQAGSAQLARAVPGSGPSATARLEPKPTKKPPAPAELPQTPADPVSKLAGRNVEPAPQKPPVADGAKDLVRPATAVPPAAKPAAGFTLFSSAEPVSGVAFFNDGTLIVTGQHPSVGMQHWDLAKRSSDRHSGDTPTAIFHIPGTDQMALPNTRGYFGLIDRHSYVTVRDLLHGTLRPLDCAAATPDGKLVAAGGVDGAFVWNVDPNGRRGVDPTLHWTALPLPPTCIALSPDGKQLFAGCAGGWQAGKPQASNDALMHVVELQTQRERSFKAHAGGTRAMVFSPDGKRLYTAGQDRKIRAWKPAAGQREGEFSGHTGAVTCLAIDATGRWLCSASEDGTLRAWDERTGRQLEQWRVHSGAVRGVAISPDGHTIVSVGEDGKVQVTPFAGPQPVAAATARAPTVELRERVPVPSAEAQEQALALVKLVFKDAYAAAKKPDGRQALAAALAEQADKSEDDTEGYVLLTQASSAAMAAGEIESGFDLVRRTTERYAVELWPALVEAAEDSLPAAGSPGARKALARAALALYDEALASGEFDAAKKLFEVALTSAKKSGDPPLVRQITERSRDVAALAKQQAEVKAAGETLAADPEDAAANLIFGKHWCLVKEDWSRGLPHLVKGADKRLAAAAALDQAQPDDPLKQVAVADAWWDLAAAEKGEEKAQLQARACKWYEQAIPRLSGLQKKRAEKRCQEAAPALPAVAGKSAAPAPAAKTPPPAVAGKSETGMPGKAAPGKSAQQARARTVDKSGKTIELPITPEVSLRLRLIPAGRFVMGFPADEQNHGQWHTEHEVTISKPFYLCVTEVTRDQWKAVYGNMPGPYIDHPGDLAATSISWNECQDFINRLNQMIGSRKVRLRLPTSAEWEYACRAGTTTAYYSGADPASLNAYEWTRGNVVNNQRHAVGTLKPNPWGLYDMLGNVREWCADNFAEKVAGTPVTDPQGPPDNKGKVTRGGSAGADAIWCRVTESGRLNADSSDPGIGLRLAADLIGTPPPAAKGSAR